MAEPILNLPGEIWKPVVGWEQFYHVSLDREFIIHSPNCRPHKQHYTGKLLSLVAHPRGGYLVVPLRHKKTKTTRFVHQLVLESFISPRPEGFQACHTNGDCRDNRLENLRWDTVSSNMLDRERHGTGRVREAAKWAKLSAKDVEFIREHYQERHSEFGQRPLARRFGVKPSSISCIVSGKTWRHL